MKNKSHENHESRLIVYNFPAFHDAHHRHFFEGKETKNFKLIKFLMLSANSLIIHEITVKAGDEAT